MLAHRTDTERGDAVADLVERDQRARHRRRLAREFGAGETDAERQKSRTSESGGGKCSNAAGGTAGAGDDLERDGQQHGQRHIDPARRQKRSSKAITTRPSVTITQNAVSANAASCAGTWRCVAR